ncbi:hypothetical protein SPRG_19651 [Saprolegnia parasitica CBS 223.65]|uniref:Uncharacterized protein n=1 Tax=Saprolegnia parasitica (strain CBS 223.65) TaxID=695850 RepID=A0A067CIC5_SAPPC|nr:hypothetical protein SPRG_19651 [Saprolegnia parasitica CBS 223.65]KDO30494.1 hypothetical protein SPRG_19651 [Saprolegnia parasitica CBS 223.65]|eukprot:XP_012198878.1 hypothetical protein SPRG_19651 [Saprolegnia parasitica CBS 223.65]
MSLLDTIAAEPRAHVYERRPSLGVDLHVHVRQVRLPNGRKVFASLLQQHGLRAKCFVVSSGRPTAAAVVTGTSLQDTTVLEWVGTTGIVTMRLHQGAICATLHIEIICGSLVLASAELALNSISNEAKFPSTWIPLSPDGDLELSIATTPLVANNEDITAVLKEDATTTEIDDDKRGDSGAPSPEKCAREEGDDVNNDETIIDEAPTFSFYHREPIHDQFMQPPKVDAETWHLFKFGIASDPPPSISHHSGVSASALERTTPFIAGPGSAC